MSDPLIDKSFEGMLRQIRREVTILQRRFLRSPDGGRGTAAERDGFFGVPANDAERAALANRQVKWFNMDKGWEESYYAVTGTPDLTARGLISTAAAGWYPTGRADTHWVCQTGGSQNIGAVGATANINTFATREDKGDIVLSLQRLVVPRAGFYYIEAKVYTTGGSTSISVGFNVSGTALDITSTHRFPGIIQMNARADADESNHFGGECLLAAGEGTAMACRVNAIFSGSSIVRGDSDNWGWGTNYRLTYIRPPLVDDAP